MKRLTIGWREWAGLPEIGIPVIKAKADTGARTSCLHAFEIKPFKRDGETWVRFMVQPLQGKKKLIVQCEAKVIARRMVSDSGGHREQRYVIATMLCIGEQNWPIEMTLSNRATMRFRMLLGRKAMAGKVKVDPDGSFLQGHLTTAHAREIYAS